MYFFICGQQNKKIQKKPANSSFFWIIGLFKFLKSRFRKSILFCCIKNSFNSASPCFLLQISKTTAYNHYYTDYQIDKPPFFHLLAPLYPCIIIQVYDSAAYFSIQEKHQKNNRKINGFQLCIIFGEIFTKKFF